MKQICSKINILKGIWQDLKLPRSLMLIWDGGIVEGINIIYEYNAFNKAIKNLSNTSGMYLQDGDAVMVYVLALNTEAFLRSSERLVCIDPWGIQSVFVCSDLPCFYSFFCKRKVKPYRSIFMVFKRKICIQNIIWFTKY